MLLNHLDLFSGIGGFALAARWLGGIKTIGFCEIDPFCQKVLAKNFPGVPIHDDIKTLTDRTFPGRIDLITAGFPCQPHSQAGKKQASKDDRDLWPELYRVICKVQPRWIVLENVPGLLSSEAGRFFRGILWQLAQAGFDAEWGVVSCLDLGGSHRRERLWIVAYSNGNGRSGTDGIESNSNQHRVDPASSQKWQTVGYSADASSALLKEVRLSRISQVPRAPDGVPGGLDRRRREQIKALGNAVVPQVAMIPLQRVLDLSRQQKQLVNL